MANKDVKKKLEDITIPFRDLKNIVEELRFEDEPTRARCRGWIVLQSKKFLQANILFPGSDIDCRLSIRARSGNIDAQLFQSFRGASHIYAVFDWYRRMTFPGTGSIGGGGWEGEGEGEGKREREGGEGITYEKVGSVRYGITDKTPLLVAFKVCFRAHSQK